jgi:hypothetical protein
MLAFRSIVWLDFPMGFLWLRLELSTGNFRACGLYKGYKKIIPAKLRCNYLNYKIKSE